MRIAIQLFKSAAENMDWMQPVLNQSEPCFQVQKDGSFCGRAPSWAGHGELDKFISMSEMLTAFHAQVLREAAEDIDAMGKQCIDAPKLKQACHILPAVIENMAQAVEKNHEIFPAES